MHRAGQAIGDNGRRGGWMMRREGVRSLGAWSMPTPYPFTYLRSLFPTTTLTPFKLRFEDGNLNSPLLGMQTTWRGSCWTWHRLLPSLPFPLPLFLLLLPLCCAARSICFLTPSSSAPFTISLSFLASCSQPFLGRLSPSSPYITKPTLPPPSFILAPTSSPHGSPYQDGMGGGGGSFV